MPAPDDAALAVAAHGRLLDRVASLTNPDVARPSRLPGWTVGHVLTHLARNADGVAGIFAAAAEGRVGDQYPGGQEQREREIGEGAKRPAKTLVADLRTSVERLEAAWVATTDEAWATGRGRTYAGGELSLPEIVYRRVREVEVHHVDLGLGYEATDWPAPFVGPELQRALAGLPERLSPADRAAFTAWLLDRGPLLPWSLAPWS